MATCGDRIRLIDARAIVKGSGDVPGPFSVVAAHTSFSQTHATCNEEPAGRIERSILILALKESGLCLGMHDKLQRVMSKTTKIVVITIVMILGLLASAAVSDATRHGKGGGSVWSLAIVFIAFGVARAIWRYQNDETRDLIKKDDDR